MTLNYPRWCILLITGAQKWLQLGNNIGPGHKFIRTSLVRSLLFSVRVTCYETLCVYRYLRILEAADSRIDRGLGSDT